MQRTTKSTNPFAGEIKVTCKRLGKQRIDEELYLKADWQAFKQTKWIDLYKVSVWYSFVSMFQNAGVFKLFQFCLIRLKTSLIYKPAFLIEKLFSCTVKNVFKLTIFPH